MANQDQQALGAAAKSLLSALDRKGLRNDALQTLTPAQRAELSAAEASGTNRAR